MYEDYGDYPLPLWWEQYEFDPSIEEFDWDEEEDVSRPVGWYELETEDKDRND